MSCVGPTAAASRQKECNTNAAQQGSEGIFGKDAYIRGWSASQMEPMAGEEVTGALWYTTVLKDTKCQTDGLTVTDNDEQAMYFEKPDGMSNSTDTLNFAVVVPSAGAGWKVQLFSDGSKVLDAKLNPGLNYGTIPGKKAGWQRMHIVDGAGSIVRVAAGGRCVSSGCPDCIYNMNPQVVPLSENTEDNGSCPIDCSPPETFTPDVCDDGPFSLDTLLDDTPDVPDMCINEYLITALADALQDALNAYEDILDDGYDAKFKTYADYTRQAIPEQLDAYMSEHAPDRFSCLEERHQQCCKDCKVACGVCVKGDDCETGVRNFTEPCTKFVPHPGLGNGHEANTVWHFTLSDEDGFYNDVSTSYGIDKEWVTFGNRVSNYASGCWSDKCDENMYWTGYPMRAPNVDIQDPKDAIADGIVMLRNLHEDLADAALAAANDLYPDDLADVVDAATIPVLMAREAVDAMKQVVEEAEDIEEQQRKQMILNFVLGILMFIPAAGEAIGAVGLTTLARVITLIGDVGATAFGVYEIVEDPESAVVVIFSLLMGAGGGGRGDFRKAGSTRRGMKEKDYAGLGTKIRAQMNKVSTKRKGCY